MCGFIYNDDEINENTLDSFYKKENFYYSEGSFGTGGNDLCRYDDYVTFLAPYLEQSNVIVDVGCGKGQLVKYLIDHGFVNASGIEPDKRMVEIAVNNGIPVTEGSALRLALNPHSADLMIYTHVFEHLLDPDDIIRHAEKCLKPDGMLFIEVPDASQYSKARVFDFFWLATVEHINHFNNHYLELLLANQGFKMIAKSEMLMPYNNPSYSYPSLKMLFQKNGNMKRKPCRTGYNEQLRDEIVRHIEDENYFLADHRQIVNELKHSDISLYVWGIGREFFVLSSFTDLMQCNIQALLDKNKDKQGKTVGGINIVSPEHLEKAGKNSAVLITSVFNKFPMRDYLREISYGGSVLFIDQKGS